MLYAIGEILLFLCVAAVLGFILGWILRAPGLVKELEARWKTAYDAERRRANKLSRELEECAKKGEALESQLNTVNAVEEVPQEALPVTANVEFNNKMAVNREQVLERVADIARRTAGDKKVADDDLKKIKGIGPKLEKLLKGLGLTSFRQVANFKSEDIEYVAAALKSFPTRIERDNWMEGARQEHIKKYGEQP